MSNIDFWIVKVKKKMRQRRERRIRAWMKKIFSAIAVGAVALVSMGAVDGKDYRLVEEIYVVQSGDTLQTIGETYMAKNTYGRRYLPEFIEGIKEENNLTGEVEPGQKIRITWWEKRG